MKVSDVIAQLATMNPDTEINENIPLNRMPLREQLLKTKVKLKLECTTEVALSDFISKEDIDDMLAEDNYGSVESFVEAMDEMEYFDDFKREVAIKVV